MNDSKDPAPATPTNRTQSRLLALAIVFAAAIYVLGGRFEIVAIHGNGADSPAYLVDKLTGDAWFLYRAKAEAVGIAHGSVYDQ